MCKNLAAGLAVLLLVASNANAQTAVQPRQAGVQPQGNQAVPGTSAGAQQGGAMTNVDHAIAACLLLGNQEEIALSQFAQDHVKGDEVKEFAKMMSDEHKQAIQKLRQLAPQLASLGENLQAGRSSQGGTNQGQNAPGGIGQNGVPGAQPGQASQQTGGQLASADPMMGQMLALQQRISQECLSLTQDELSKHEGSDFDRCYLGQQLVAHTQMLAKLRGSEQFASPQLRSFIDEATKTVEKHLDKAKEIAKSYEEEGARSGSGRSASRSEDSRR